MSDAKYSSVRKDYFNGFRFYLFDKFHFYEGISWHSVKVKYVKLLFLLLKMWNDISM